MEDTPDTPALLIVPNELVLSRDFLDEHAKVDKHFRELLDVAGRKVWISSYPTFARGIESRYANE